MKIYHNPKCATSRNVLKLIIDAGITPEIILYLKNPPPRREILELAALTQLPLHDLIRKKGTPYHELGLSPDSSEETLLLAYEANPILLERPIVVGQNQAKICRPKDIVIDLIQREIAG